MHLPAGVPVVFLADRGFSNERLMRLVDSYGWAWRIRIRGNQVLKCDGREMTPRMLALQKGNALLFRESIVFGRGLARVSLSAGWPKDGDEPWFVLSNTEASAEIFTDYALRFGIEEEFRDEKSGGLRLEDSCLNAPAALERLILVVAAASVVVLSEGLCVAARGSRREVDSHWERGLSYFQIGWRWIVKQLGKTSEKLVIGVLALRAIPDSLPVAPTRKEALRRRERKEPMCLFKNIMHCNCLDW